MKKRKRCTQCWGRGLRLFNYSDTYANGILIERCPCRYGKRTNLQNVKEQLVKLFDLKRARKPQSFRTTVI